MVILVLCLLGVIVLLSIRASREFVLSMRRVLMRRVRVRVVSLRSLSVVFALMSVRLIFID